VGKDGAEMTELEKFLETNVEGYLFEDLETLKDAPLRAGKEAGAVGYPLLMTTFAGIELFGNLVSQAEFDPNAGSKRFEEFWRDYLYKGDSEREAAGPILYQLARHGLAHVFVVKADVAIVKNEPNHHLVKIGSTVYVDAVRLAIDFRDTYDEKIKPEVAKGGTLATTMADRLQRMKTIYAKQSAKLPGLNLPPPSSPVPSPTPSIAVPVTQSFSTSGPEQPPIPIPPVAAVSK